MRECLSMINFFLVCESIWNNVLPYVVQCFLRSPFWFRNLFIAIFAPLGNSTRYPTLFSYQRIHIILHWILPQYRFITTHYWWKWLKVTHRTKVTIGFFKYTKRSPETTDFMFYFDLCNAVSTSFLAGCCSTRATSCESSCSKRLTITSPALFEASTIGF